MAATTTGRLADQFIRLCFFGLIILIPFQIYFDVYGSVSLTVTSILITLTLALMAGRIGGNPLRLLTVGDPIGTYLLLLIGSMVLSTVLAVDMVVSLKYLVKWTIYLATFWVAYQGLRRYSDRDDVLWALALAAAISTLIGIFFFLLGPKALESFLRSRSAALFIDPATLKFGDINWFRGGGTGGTFFNRNWYAAFVGMILPYAFIRTILVRERRFAWLSLTLILLAGLLVSMSRGGWVGAAAAMAIMLFHARRRNQRLFLVIAVVAVLAVIVPGILVPAFRTILLERMQTILVIDARLNRIYFWSSTLNALAMQPLFGVGVACNPAGAAHGDCLQIIVEQGLVGGIIYLLLFLSIFGRLAPVLARPMARTDFALGLGLLGIWTGFWVHGLLSTTLFNDKMMMTFALVLALTTAFLQDKQTTGEPLAAMGIGAGDAEQV